MAADLVITMTGKTFSSISLDKPPSHLLPSLFRGSQHFSVEPWPPAMPILQSPLHSQAHTQSACPIPPYNQIMLRSLGLIRPFIMDAHCWVNLANGYEENSGRTLSPLMVVRGGTVESLRQSLGKKRRWALGETRILIYKVCNSVSPFISVFFFSLSLSPAHKLFRSCCAVKCL